VKEGEIAVAGASRIDSSTGLPLVQVSRPLTGDDDLETWGELPVLSGLGTAALPAAKSSSGYAEVLFQRDIGGFPAAIVGMRDKRTAATIAQLAPGESCLFSTGEGFDSRVFCKDGSVSMIVDNDTVVTLGRSGGFKVSAGGAFFEVSEDGIKIVAPDGSFIQLGGGIARVSANSTFIGGGTAYIPAAGTTSPPAAIPSTAVQIAVA